MKKEILILIFQIIIFIILFVYSSVVNGDYYSMCCNCNNPPVNLGWLQLLLLISITINIGYVEVKTYEQK